MSSQYDLIGRAFYITYHKIHVFSPTFYHVGFCLLYFILGIILFIRDFKLKRNKLIMKMKTSEHEADLLNSLPTSNNNKSNTMRDSEVVQSEYVTKIRTKQCSIESNSSTVTQLVVDEVQGGVDGGSKPVQCERHDVSGTEEDPNKDRNYAWEYS